MCPRTSAPNPSMKKCWPCRRRRLKCDGGLPGCRKCRENGVECTYTKPLTWVGGVASRGHMVNSTFDRMYEGRRDAAVTSGPYVPGSSDNRPGLSFRPSDFDEVTNLDVLPELSRGLTDPLFQDLGYNSRFLVDYYQRRVCPAMFLVNDARNPYTQAITMIGASPALANAILAVAACHCAHGATGSPLFSLLNGRAQRLTPSTPILFPTNTSSASTFSHSDLLNQYLLLKHKSLRHLSSALESPDGCRQNATLATILFLALLELLESGAGFWSVHIEGAKKLLEGGVSNGTDSGADLLKAMIDELTLFDTFGSTLISPGVLTRSIRSRLNDAEEETPRLTGIGCPTEIMLAIDSVSSERQLGAELELQDAELHAQSLSSTLRRIQGFDTQEWARNVIFTDFRDPGVSPGDLAHVGTIWKLAAEIYASRLLYNINKDPTVLIPLVDVMRHEYTLLGSDHHFMNALIWPTFVAGAASTRLDQREWVVGVLERIWNGTLLANGKNAPLVLGRLWEKQDSAREMGAGELEGWDWISELSSLEDRWIFL